MARRKTISKKGKKRRTKAIPKRRMNMDSFYDPFSGYFADYFRDSGQTGRTEEHTGLYYDNSRDLEAFGSLFTDYEKAVEIIGDQSDSYITSKFNRAGEPVDHEIAIEALGDTFVTQGSHNRGGFSQYGDTMKEKRNIDCTIKFLNHYRAEERSTEIRESIRTAAQNICSLMKNANDPELDETDRMVFKNLIAEQIKDLEKI